MDKEFLTQEEINQFVDTYAKIGVLIEDFGREVFNNDSSYQFMGNSEYGLEDETGGEAFMNIAFDAYWTPGCSGHVSTDAFLSQEQWDAAVQSEKDHQLDRRLDELSDKFSGISDEDLKLWAEHQGLTNASE